MFWSGLRTGLWFEAPHIAIFTVTIDKTRLRYRSTLRHIVVLSYIYLFAPLVVNTWLDQTKLCLRLRGIRWALCDMFMCGAADAHVLVVSRVWVGQMAPHNINMPSWTFEMACCAIKRTGNCRAQICAYSGSLRVGVLCVTRMSNKKAGINLF